MHSCSHSLAKLLSKIVKLNRVARFKFLELEKVIWESKGNVSRSYVLPTSLRSINDPTSEKPLEKRSNVSFFTRCSGQLERETQDGWKTQEARPGRHLMWKQSVEGIIQSWFQQYNISITMLNRRRLRGMRVTKSILRGIYFSVTNSSALVG